MGAEGKDKFGFSLGTKRALAAQLYERGATQSEIIAATGITQYNMLKDAERRGHRVVRKGDRYWLVHASDPRSPQQQTGPEGNAVMPDNPSISEEKGGRVMSSLLDRIRADLANDRFYKDNFPNDGQRFLAWYLRNCYLRTLNQVRDDITDGPNDKEIDAVIVDEEKRQIIIIQSKFFTGPIDHQPLQEILSVWAQFQNLAALQENSNSRLQVKLATVAQAIDEEYEIIFEVITTGTLTDDAKKDLAVFQSALSDLQDLDASLTVVDSVAIQTRWTEASGKDLPKLTHEITLQGGQYLNVNIANFRTVLATIPLAECLKFPGITDGKLFRPNVRQSLGLTNKINRAMKKTLNGDHAEHFFFYHNGITALCEKLSLDSSNHQLRLDGLGVVNGCQSPTTILSCSERVKMNPDAHVLVRFYEIPQRDLADKISINTNSQSAVKPRDLRSNDKRVLALKKAYENSYPSGCFLTKRGDERPADRDKTHTIDITQLAKWLMAWHCQRSNNSHNENQLFDKHFELLFHSDYSPSDIAALHFWVRAIDERWSSDDLQLNEALLAYSWSKFHLLYAIQLFFSTASRQVDKVPIPSATIGYPDPSALISFAASCYNAAFEAGRAEYAEKERIFSPQNWLKSKDSLAKLKPSIQMHMNFMGNLPNGAQLRQALQISTDRFGPRWVAD
jgi:AIPR protein